MFPRKADVVLSYVLRHSCSVCVFCCWLSSSKKANVALLDRLFLLASKKTVNIMF